MGVKQPFEFDWSQVEFGIMKLTDMTPNPNNPRTISEDDLESLKNSLTDSPRNLLLNPIKLNHENVVIGGNQRHTGLKQLGYKEVPYIKAGEDFTDDEIRQFIVMDNVPAGSWDTAELANQYEWEELNSWGVDVPDWEETELDYALLDDENVERFEDGLRKAIQIEFKTEDYGTAYDLISKLRKEGKYIGGIILSYLKKENEAKKK